MAIENEGRWMNSGGNWTKKKHIPRHIIERDKTVAKIMRKANALERQMRKVKQSIVDDVNAYLNKRRELAGVDPDKNTKGNLILSDYANLNAVEIAVNNMIAFDEGLNIAKGIIDNCLRKWSKGANDNIRAVVDEAFNVDKKGRVNTYMIMRLTKIRINDAEWNKAMKMITDSMTPVGTRRYLSFRKRGSQDDKFESVNLNFSSL